MSSRFEARNYRSEGQKDKRVPRVGILVFVTFVGAHLELGTVAAFPVTLGSLTGSVLVFKLRGSIAFPPIVVVTVGVASMVLLINYLRSPLELPTTEFLGTLMLMGVATAILAQSRTNASVSELKETNFFSGCYCSLIAVTLVSVTQTLMGSMGNDSAFNLWGNFQYLYPYDPQVSVLAYPRAQGFYLEPSYNAFMAGSITVCLMAWGQRRGRVAVLCIAALIVTQSATGILAVAVAAAVVAASRRGSGPKLQFLAVLLALGAVLGEQIWNRLMSISTAGTSANYRLLAPIEVLQDVLEGSPTGQPLGSIEQVMGQYGLLNGVDVGTSIDNGYYVIVFYFGLAGLFSVICGVWWSLVRLRTNASMPWSDVKVARMAATVWIPFSLFFSGGILLPEFAIVTSLVLTSAYFVHDGIEGTSDDDA